MFMEWVNKNKKKENETKTNWKELQLHDLNRQISYYVYNNNNNNNNGVRYD